MSRKNREKRKIFFVLKYYCALRSKNFIYTNKSTLNYNPTAINPAINAKVPASIDPDVLVAKDLGVEVDEVEEDEGVELDKARVGSL